MFERAWRWFGKERTVARLTLLLAIMTAVAGGGWAVFTEIVHNATSPAASPGSTTITVNQGIGSNGNTIVNAPINFGVDEKKADIQHQKTRDEINQLLHRQSASELDALLARGQAHVVQFERTYIEAALWEAIADLRAAVAAGKNDSRSRSALAKILLGQSLLLMGQLKKRASELSEAAALLEAAHTESFVEALEDPDPFVRVSSPVAVKGMWGQAEYAVGTYFKDASKIRRSVSILREALSQIPKHPNCHKLECWVTIKDDDSMLAHEELSISTQDEPQSTNGKTTDRRTAVDHLCVWTGKETSIDDKKSAEPTTKWDLSRMHVCGTDQPPSIEKITVVDLGPQDVDANDGQRDVRTARIDLRGKLLLRQADQEVSELAAANAFDFSIRIHLNASLGMALADLVQLGKGEPDEREEAIALLAGSVTEGFASDDTAKMKSKLAFLRSQKVR